MIASGAVRGKKERMRRSAGALVACFVVSALLLGVGTAAQAADRSFSIRFQTNDSGNIAMAANTIMTCPASDPTCAAAQGGAPDNNNDYVMTWVDVDSDGTTFDSSSADLTLPAGATVLFAGLYWGGDVNAGTGGVDAPDPTAKGSVELAVPGGAYATVSASQVDTSSAQPARYQGFADVTAAVAAAGNGTYTVADVQAATGNDRYGGWSLVVAYHDAAQPPRNLTVFDGFQTVNAGNPTVTIPVSGFLTPLSGPVNTELGFVTWEGDRGLTGDSATLDGTTLTDALHPPTNFFNSTISDLGVNVTTKNPNYDNQLGFDSSLIDASGILANGATTATITTHTGGETFFPGVITFATDLYAPYIDPAKSATDLNGGSLEPGDVIEYSITGTNAGQDGAANTVVTDPIPAGTTYVPGSLDIVSSPGGISGPKTDAPGDDQAEENGSGVTFRVGAGANASTGGALASGESFEVRFRVRVASPTPDGTTITNRARVSEDAATLPGLHLANNSPPVVLTVSAPDLVLAKSHTGNFVRGFTGTFLVTASNQGTVASQGKVTVTDPLPPSLVPTAASGPGWTCTVNAPDVTCSRNDALAAGASYPGITVTVRVSVSAPASVTNVAAVSGGNDGDTTNNTASDTVDIDPAADLSIVKTLAPAPPVAGGVLVYTLRVADHGPDDATGVTVTDPLPAKLTSPTATTSQGSCSITTGTLTCALGGLAKGATATIRVTGTVAAGTEGTTIKNTATVTGDQPDPDLGNNTSTVTATIQATRIRLTKTASPTSVTAGADVHFTIVLRVTGPVAAKNVHVCDALPTNMSFVAFPGGTLQNGKACWTFAGVARGGSRTMTLTALVASDAPTGVEHNIARATTGNAGTAHAQAAVDVTALPPGTPPPVTG